VPFDTHSVRRDMEAKEEVADRVEEKVVAAAVALGVRDLEQVEMEEDEEAWAVDRALEVLGGRRMAAAGAMDLGVVEVEQVEHLNRRPRIQCPRGHLSAGTSRI